MNLVLMSINPRFAKYIYDNVKKNEYRKFYSSICEGDLIFIYETFPVSKITGSFFAGKIKKCSNVEADIIESDPIVRNDIINYLNSSTRFSAIEIKRPKKFTFEYLLDDIFSGLRPPQSYVFLEKNKWDSLQLLEMIREENILSEDVI